MISLNIFHKICLHATGELPDITYYTSLGQIEETCDKADVSATINVGKHFTIKPE